MRYGISIPQSLTGAGFSPALFRAHLARAEALGFDSAWTQEQTLGTTPQLSPIETMTYAAACTDRLRLGCAVFVLPLHNPLLLAKGLATLDHLSEGRVEVGVGIGGKQRMPAFGVDPDGLATRFTEQIRLMQACWTEQEITFGGRFWRLEKAAMEPKPLQRPHPPLWIGGRHPAALRRAARLGDGFVGAGSATTEAFAGQVRTLRAALDEAGRDPARFGIAKRVYVAVDDDGDRARERLAAALERYYGSAGLADVAVAGTPGECARGLADVAAAGAERALLTTLYDDTAQMELLAADVLPRL